MLSVKEAAELLLSWDNILILSHASPDGDTLGSAAALLRALSSLGKTMAFDCADKIPKKFMYLFEGIELQENFDHIVSVDVADPKLLGALEEKYSDKIELGIDHHKTHVKFSHNLLLDYTAAANCQIIYELILELGVTIDTKIADCLYTGITTDTGCFKYSNVTKVTHLIAAELLENGAAAPEINRAMFDTKTKACMDVERIVLSELEFHFDNKLALISIPQKLIIETGADESELEGLPSIPRSIEGVEVGITLKEKEDGIWKASVRTNGLVDASKLCRKLGGGGHKGAAGCSFGNDLNKAKEQLLSASKEELEKII